jgi:hypothetical protein
MVDGIEASRGRAFLVCLLTLAAALPWSAAPTTASDASKEQCSCLVAHDASRAGAEAVNAAACVRQQLGSWCDIFVATLEGTVSQQQFVLALLSAGEAVKRGDPKILAALLIELLDNFSRNTSGDPHRAVILDQDRKILEAEIFAGSEFIARCIEWFSVGEVVSSSAGRLSCRIGRVSHWMTIGVSVEDREYAYLIAPPQ